MAHHGWPHEIGLWRRRSLTIPPKSAGDWMQFAVWQIWMGVLLSAAFGFGVRLLVIAPNQILSIPVATTCSGPGPVQLPCVRMMYGGGLLNVAFTALCGIMMIGVALWLLWELWSAVEPKPISDDFLKLLNDSFGRDWRNPLTWPWSRVIWAYGFTAVGASIVVIASLALMV